MADSCETVYCMGMGVWAYLFDGRDGKRQNHRLKDGRQVERGKKKGEYTIWERMRVMVVAVCVSALTML